MTELIVYTRRAIPGRKRPQWVASRGGHFGYGRSRPEAAKDLEANVAALAAEAKIKDTQAAIAKRREAERPTALHLRDVYARLGDIHNAQGGGRDYALRLFHEVEPGLLTMEIVTPWGPLRLWTLPLVVARENMEIGAALSGFQLGPGVERTEANGLVAFMMPVTHTRARLLTIIDAELVKL